jgi:hypothetical protein
LFLLQLYEAVEAQHANLMKLVSLPLPIGADKEAVVRVNINRLNRVSYWHCIDKAGPIHKTAVRRAIVGASNFPDTFRAVDEAIRTAPASRQGRRAKSNQISLVVMCKDAASVFEIADSIGTVHRTEVETGWAASIVYDEGWAAASVQDEREASLLESEWNLRVIILGDPFVSSLLTDTEPHRAACIELLEFFKPVLGPGTRATTREARTEEFQSMVARWPRDGISTSAFWAAGQSRSSQYESSLSRLLVGYNTGGETFLGYRPDYIVEAFSPCEVTRAMTSDAEEITRVIQRNAHVLEFTACAAPTLDAITGYLGLKLGNYVRITQDQ